MEGFNVLVAHDGEQALALLDYSVELIAARRDDAEAMVSRRQKSCVRHTRLRYASC